MAVQSTFPFDWRTGAQFIANKYAPNWWQSNAPGIADQNVLADTLGRQLYAALPGLTPQQYQGWLQDYTWLKNNGGKMPTGFVQTSPSTTPDLYVPPPAWGSTPGMTPGTTPTLPWAPGSQWAVPFPTQDSNPNVWSGLDDAKVQRALAYYSAALPYAELAESSRRFGQEQAWRQKVDAWGVSGRSQLPSGGMVRRY